MLEACNACLLLDISALLTAWFNCSVLRQQSPKSLLLRPYFVISTISHPSLTSFASSQNHNTSLKKQKNLVSLQEFATSARSMGSPNVKTRKTKSVRNASRQHVLTRKERRKEKKKERKSTRSKNTRVRKRDYGQSQSALVVKVVGPV